jgi:hypothetical protein
MSLGVALPQDIAPAECYHHYKTEDEFGKPLTNKTAERKYY